MSNQSKDVSVENHTVVNGTVVLTRMKKSESIYFTEGSNQQVLQKNQMILLGDDVAMSRTEEGQLIVKLLDPQDQEKCTFQIILVDVSPKYVFFNGSNFIVYDQNDYLYL